MVALAFYLTGLHHSIESLFNEIKAHLERIPRNYEILKETYADIK